MRSKRNVFNIKAIYLAAFLSLALSSCVQVKSTFDVDYTTQLKVSAANQMVITPTNESVILVGHPSSLINKQHTAISRVETANGHTQWAERVHRLGDVVSTPSNVIIIEEENIALIFGYTKGTLLSPVRYQISAIDLMSQKQLWSREERSGSGYSSNGFYLPKNKSLVIQTPDGMQSFDVKTGNVLWDINDLSFNVNFGGISLRLLQSTNVNFLYIEELDRFLLQADSKIYLFNPYTGKSDWDIQSIGDIRDAALFIEDGFAVFYGSTGQRTAQSMTNTQSNDVLGVATRAISAVSSGLRLSPIYLLDLNTGQVKWRNDYHTNGQSKVLLVDNKLLLTGLVTYTFDIETGEKLWQNVSSEELNKEGVFSVFAEFTGFDLSASGKTVKEAQVVGNSIFVIYPELFDNRARRNQVSIRLYDFEKGELIWKTDPQRVVVRDFFFQSGLIFVLIDGKFSRSSKLLALDPYTGDQMYEIETREPLNNLVFTDELVFHTNVLGELRIYHLRNGEVLETESLGKSVVDIMDMDDKIMVVYNSFKSGMILAFHDRNNFGVISHVQLPFYSRNFETINNQFFIKVDGDKIKGIAHVDLNKMELVDFISVSAKGKKTVKGQSRNIILDPYHLLIDSEAKHLYAIEKKKLVRYGIKPQKL